MLSWAGADKAKLGGVHAWCTSNKALVLAPTHKFWPLLLATCHQRYAGGLDPSAIIARGRDTLLSLLASASAYCS
jgi:hypothetical protein